MKTLQTMTLWLSIASAATFAGLVACSNDPLAEKTEDVAQFTLVINHAKNEVAIEEAGVIKPKEARGLAVAVILVLVLNDEIYATPPAANKVRFVCESGKTNGSNIEVEVTQKAAWSSQVAKLVENSFEYDAEKNASRVVVIMQ